MSSHYDRQIYQQQQNVSVAPEVPRRVRTQGHASHVREIHKNAWLKYFCQNEKKGTPFNIKKYEKHWVVFCVHDDVEAMLEFYTDPKIAATHKPSLSMSLNQCLHVSSSIIGQDNEYEFSVAIPNQVIRLVAVNWEQMTEWVESLTGKLREMKILSPKDNLYSRMPEIQCSVPGPSIRFPNSTRDPNSPLPPPPPTGSINVTGHEVSRQFSSNAVSRGDELVTEHQTTLLIPLIDVHSGFSPSSSSNSSVTPSTQIVTVSQGHRSDTGVSLSHVQNLLVDSTTTTQLPVNSIFNLQPNRISATVSQSSDQEAEALIVSSCENLVNLTVGGDMVTQNNTVSSSQSAVADNSVLLNISSTVHVTFDDPSLSDQQPTSSSAMIQNSNSNIGNSSLASSASSFVTRCPILPPSSTTLISSNLLQSASNNISSPVPSTSTTAVKSNNSRSFQQSSRGRREAIPGFERQHSAPVSCQQQRSNSQENLYEHLFIPDSVVLSSATASITALKTSCPGSTTSKDMKNNNVDESVPPIIPRRNPKKLIRSSSGGQQRSSSLSRLQQEESTVSNGSRDHHNNGESPVPTSSTRHHRHCADVIRSFESDITAHSSSHHNSTNSETSRPIDAMIGFRKGEYRIRRDDCQNLDPSTATRTTNGASHIPLKEQQVMRLKSEINNAAGGVRIVLRKKDCVDSIAFVDYLGAVCSNVSSLSRTSVTPVSGSSSQLPPTLSPLQNLQSYSKAASWLSTVPRLSPSRPPPPPPHSSSSSTSLISGSSQYSPSISGPLSISAGTAPSPHSVFPGLVPGAPHPHSSAMFAPPILPLSSISQHPSGHPSPFGPDALFHGSSTSSELVRRDLESRFLSSERPSFMTRPGDLHHHHLLPPLSGVNHLPPQSPGGAHSALFPPPLFKDLPKLGLDSPFYRTNMAMSYPGFNGILPPNLQTPFTPPNQIAAFTPKITDACKPAKVMKSGRWNAMHVRIAWEIYHDQQKGGGESKNRNSSSPATAKSSVLAPPTSSASNTIAPPPPNTELLRQPPHVFGLSRPPDVGPSGPGPFSAALLSPHHSAQHPPPSPHSMFLNSAPHFNGMPRYPGFSLGPAYGGLSGLGSSGLPSLALGPTAQEHWHRSHRGPPYPGPLGTGWPMQRPERDVKTPNESRRHKEDRADKRSESHHTPDSGRGDLSPFRDRSPVRPSRTPLENGDTDSRSSDSHSVHATSNNKTSGRMKDETNGDLDRTTPLMNLERDKHQSLISATHPSRLFHPPGGSPMTPITSGWDSFPGMMQSGPRMSGSDSFRLSLQHTVLQLSERERELSRLPHNQIRPNLFSNGPFANMSLGMGHPGSSGNSKNIPSGGPNPLLNPKEFSMSMAAAAAAAHNHLLHSSSLNGPNSPKHDEMNSAPNIRTKEESQSR